MTTETIAVQGSKTRPPKVLVTKIGLDGHDRGSRLIATYLRDAGMEVLYTPPWQPIPAVVKMVLEEDVDVIGISSLATDHRLVPKLVAALRSADLGHVAVIVGGIVPEEDERVLLEAGVARVFHPGSPFEEIVAAMRSAAAESRERRDRSEESPADASLAKGESGR